MSKKPTHEELKQRVKKLEQKTVKHKQTEEAPRESEERYRTLIENIPVGVYRTTLGPKGKFLMANPAYLKMFGFESEEELKKFCVADRFMVPSKRAEHSDNLVAQGSVTGFELLCKRKDGTSLLGSFNIKVVCDEKGKVSYFDGIVEDITERRRTEEELKKHRDHLEELVTEQTKDQQKVNEELLAEISDHKKAKKALRESEVKYRVILASIEDSYFEVNQRGEITFFNESFSKITGYPPDELMGMKNDKYLDQENRKKVFKKFNEVWKTGIPAKLFEYELIRKNGEKITAQTSASLMTDENGQKIGFRGIIRDVSDLKKTEEALRKSEARLLEAQRVAHIGNWSWDLQTNKLFWSKENYRIFCLSPEVLPSYENFERTVHPEDLDFVNKSIEDALERKKPYNSEFRIILPNNKVGFVQSIGNIEYDKEDKPLRFYGTVQDITKRKRAEEKIKASLKEKEILLQEIHHRVKNNMQIISSLLHLQASGVGDERVTDALMECRGRVQAMAFVHETLYGSDTLADIDFKTYISKVTNQIFQTFKTSMDRIKLEVDAEDIKLGIEQASPLGLITNELLTNSLKYAFPENRSGEIVIRIRAVEQDSIEFIFSDNGIGIPGDMDWRNTDSLGLRLIILLAEDQLDGTLSLDRGKGTHFTIRFRHKENQ